MIRLSQFEFWTRGSDIARDFFQQDGHKTELREFVYQFARILLASGYSRKPGEDPLQEVARRLGLELDHGGDLVIFFHYHSAQNRTANFVACHDSFFVLVNFRLRKLELL